MFSRLVSHWWNGSGNGTKKSNNREAINNESSSSATNYLGTPTPTSSSDVPSRTTGTASGNSSSGPESLDLVVPAPAAVITQPEETSPKSSSLNKKGIGVVTTLENCMPQGTINGKYFFTVEKFQDLISQGLKRGSKVEFEAVQYPNDILWLVTSMKFYLSPEELVRQDKRRYKTIIGKVVEFRPVERVALLKYGKSSDDVQELPFESLPQDYVVIRGDFLRVKLESYKDPMMADNDADDDDDGEPTGRIISVEPTKKETIIGKVTRNHRGQLSVDNRVYFEQGVCKNFRCMPHDMVRVVAVESKYDRDYNWRAISVEKSTFLAYSAPENPDEAWLPKENTWTGSLTDLIQDKEGVVIEPKQVVNFGGVRIGDTTELAVQINNKTGDGVLLKSIHVQGDQYVCKFNIILPRPRECEEFITLLDPHSTYELKISCAPVQLGGTRELCIFDFGSFKIGRHLVVVGLSEQEEILQGIRGDKIHNPITGCKWQDLNYEDMINQTMEDKMKPAVRVAAPLYRPPFFQIKTTEQNHIPKKLWEIVKDADDDLLAKEFPDALKELRIENYQTKFEVALWLEEIQNEIIRRQHDVVNTLLERCGDNFKFEAPALRDIHPPIQIGDPVTVYDHNDPKKKYLSHVKDIRGNYVYIKFENRDEGDHNNYVTVQFNLSRTTYRRCHHALKQAEKYLGEDWLFPKSEITLKPPRLPFYEVDENEVEDADKGKYQKVAVFQKQTPRLPPSVLRNAASTSSTGGRMKSTRGMFYSDTKGPEWKPSESIRLKWFNKDLNQEHRDAVRRILRGQARPLPYIIYGPPGTGKTVTVVEAVIQLYKLDPNSRILVVAPSNSAADVITEHLVKSDLFIPGDIVRLIGFLRLDIQIPESIRDYCLDGDNLEAIARYRVIVSTCTTAGQFIHLGLDTEGHFTHVFIDEAGYCTEPEAIIPAILCAFSKEGQVILAGDPKQLGPVLMSDAAANVGLSQSLLERLMSLPLYSRNVEKFPIEKYNPVVLTKLVKNYRAHPTLLTLPSKLFYDDELQSAIDMGEVELSHSLEFLDKSKGVPLLFHGVQGRCERDDDSPSWFNKAEAVQVLNYVRKLRNYGISNEEIGIITPYRKQVEKIRRSMELGLLDDEIPKVGSVEEFQGGERKVIIMSLVRSVQQNQTDRIVDRMSFVFSPKRFNVAITRAKALLIVIGNPHTMIYDYNWRTFLKYCLDLDCYVGCNLPLDLDEQTQKCLQELKIEDEEEKTKIFERPICVGSNVNEMDDEDDDWN